MKKICAVIAMLIGISSQAQIYPIPKATLPEREIDSSKIMVSITLKAENHFLIIDCLEEISKSEWAEYVGQVAKAMDVDYKPNKAITVNLSSGAVIELYSRMAGQQERISAGLNNDLRNSMLPQLMNFTWLYKELQNLDLQNASLAQQRKMRAFSILKKIK